MRTESDVATARSHHVIIVVVNDGDGSVVWWLPDCGQIQEILTKYPTHFPVPYPP